MCPKNPALALSGLNPQLRQVAQIAAMAAVIEPDPINRQPTVDLERQQVVFPGGDAKPFTIPPRRREALLEGLDEIQLTLKQQPRISAYRQDDRQARPWIYDVHDNFR